MKKLLLAAAALLSLSMALVSSTTNQEEVNALNVLFSTMGSPALPGWTVAGGDPCSDGWKGVVCIGPNITELNLSGLNLRGGLGYALDKLTALMILDLSNNYLAGEVPFQLPLNAQKLLLSNNQLVGGLPYSLNYMNRLNYLNISSNLLDQSIPDIFHPLAALTHIDLANNKLPGAFPPSFSALTNLNTLHVQNNQLGGTIDILANMPLKDLDVSNNNFTGAVPHQLLFIPSLNYTGNHFNNSAGMIPMLLSPPPSATDFTVPTSPAEGADTGKEIGSKRSLTSGRIAGIVVASALAVIFATMGLVFARKRRKSTVRKQNPWPTPDMDMSEAMTTNSKHTTAPHVATIKSIMPIKEKISDGEKQMKGSIATPPLTFGELQAATNAFNQDNLIGEGSSARVYKAKVANGKVLAIKKLDSSIQLVHEEKDFFDILLAISRLRHANITELVGYCCENGQRILVYEYVANGTLHEALHCGEDKRLKMTWNVRIKIALGAARALEYLHEICQPMVVHRNFKSSNILLDDDFTPYLSDCGLLSLTSFGSQCQFPAQHMGSFGYSAPEFAMSGLFSVKSDVYSFGVMMLELLTGRKPLDSSRPRAEQSLVRWATPQLNDIDALSKMVDPALKGMYPAKSLSRFADIVALCVQPEPEFRPPMSEVVQSLVRLLQRASVHKRRSHDDLGSSQRVSERQEPGEGP